MKILMAAAENDALPRGKVGGIGDVVRDIPLALAAIGQEVDVVMPGYGCFSKLSGAQHVTSLDVRFGGQLQSVDIFKIAKEHSHVFSNSSFIFPCSGRAERHRRHGTCRWHSWHRPRRKSCHRKTR